MSRISNVDIPNGPGDVVFGSAAEETAFWAYVESNDYLNSHRGQVAERNGARGKDVNQFDVRVSQELPGFFGDNKAEVWMDILNVGNLLNEDWGKVDEVAFPGSFGVVEYGQCFCGLAAAAQGVAQVLEQAGVRRQGRRRVPQHRQGVGVPSLRAQRAAQQVQDVALSRRRPPQAAADMLALSGAAPAQGVGRMFQWRGARYRIVAAPLPGEP